jgi:hypothetical protein
MASEGQASTQVPHSVHLSASTTAISSSSSLIASSGHSSTQVPQLTHSSLLTTAGITNSSKVAKVGKFTVRDIRYITFVRGFLAGKSRKCAPLAGEHNPGRWRWISSGPSTCSGPSTPAFWPRSIRSPIGGSRSPERGTPDDRTHTAGIPPSGRGQRGSS